MGITASSPDAFFDREDFAWQMTVYNADGSPLTLGTGERLFVRFEDVSRAVVGICDSGAGDESLVVATDGSGLLTFRIPAAGRSWPAPLLGPLKFGITADVTGDLYRYVSGSSTPQGVCRIDFTVLPGTGSAP